MDPTTLAAALLAALLAHAPNSPARACLGARTPALVAAFAAAQSTRGVPAGLFVAVSYCESWCGCHPRSGGNFGAPIDFAHRGTAGGPDQAAAVLQHGLSHCGTWTRAVSFFRSGQCVSPAHAGYTSRVLRLAETLYTAAGAPLPAAWR